MAGHSHWAGIKHKKALIDNKRGKVWSKLSRAIIVAAKAGGGDPDTNLRLRYAINDAKAVSMPKDNIERAIKKGTGELEGGSFDEVLYEGYGPGGVAILCEILTDNRNRTAPEVRKIFEIAGGNLGATGCVAWMFERKGVVVIDGGQTDEEKLLELAMEAGAEDVRSLDGKFEVISDPNDFGNVQEALQQAGIETEMCELNRIPNDTIDLDVETARKVLKMVEKLDDHDDVQKVASNFNLPEEVMKELEMDV
ncbi:MAG: YebC/PmpR family DNA-binding transcriptional regulator [Planctomycetes bacterium]|nr:YebC/PmpR family DNA-binding transcriptional regulator [Planctomycetota bacterium]